MNIQLHRVHIQNIRSIKDADVKLGKSAVLFGMNDGGKSNASSAYRILRSLNKLKRHQALEFIITMLNQQHWRLEHIFLPLQCHFYKHLL